MKFLPFVFQMQHLRALLEAHRWHEFDPTDGTFREVTGSPFAAEGARELTPLAKNSDGANDFVLVLEANATRKSNGKN